MAKPTSREVKAAITLLSETLDAEEDRLGAVVENASEDLPANVAREVKAFARKLKAFNKRFSAFRDERNALRDMRKGSSPAARKIIGSVLLDKSPGPSTNFTVKFPDGVTINMDTAAKTLAAVVMKFGPAEVMNLGLNYCGCDFVSRSRSKKYRSASYPIPGGFYVQTQSSTAAKKKIVMDIAKGLHLKGVVVF